MSERDLIDELLQAKVKSKLFGGQHAPRLGRLVILEPLGSGGMGSVFCAYDPRLERKVAVKLVRGGGAASARVLREARMLGKLNHPNVVAVYDATETDGVISIVMELAPGESLRRWLETARAWRDVLAVMQQAGSGLAAAHRAGVVHRDVKPDNVVIGPDRARLVDFGLASPSEGESADALEGSGTPSYMAPEVLAGAPANAASDQFSFGVTLFEALYGARPHRAERGGTLEDAAREAERARVPRGREVPGWLHRVAMRALAAAPEARFPSMDALVTELGHDGRRKRQRTLIGLGALALLSVAVPVSYQRGASRDVCGAGRARVSAAWPAANLERLRASLGDTPWARKAADDFVELTAAWERSHRRVCEATRAHGGQSESLLELRMRCLDRRFDRMTALGTALAGPLDPQARENVSGAISALPRPERCESLTDASELALPDDPNERARARQAERDLDRAWAAYALGRYGEAREIAGALEQSTGGLRAPALRAALLSLLGTVEARLGSAQTARPRLEAALAEAAAAHVGHVEVEVWVRLLRNELFDGSPANVVEWAPFARAAAARAGASNGEIDGIEAEARRESGELTAARKLLARATAESAELRGDQRALIEMNLGSVELASGDPVAAEAAFGRGFELAEAQLGKGHPGLGLYLDKLAIAARERGRVGEALARHERALELRRQVYGDDDRAVATTLLRRAQTRIEAGKLSDAEGDLTRAREIRAKVHGPSHRRLAEIDLVRGDAAAARGDRARARELYQGALGLDPRLDVSTRLAEVGASVEAGALGPPGDVTELSLDTARKAALRLELLGASDAATKEAGALADAWRARGRNQAAALSNDVARAARAAGRKEQAAEAHEAALAALADEPSRERLRALVGLAECASEARAKSAASAALGLLDAMPELDASNRARLERIAKRALTRE